MRAGFACLSLVVLALGGAGLVSQTAAQPAATHSGELTAQAPRASYEVTLQAGQVVTLTTDTDTNLDTVLTLIGPDGEPVAQNDDDASGDLTSEIVYGAARAGTYTAVVTGYGNATGSFSLTITEGLNVGLSDAATILREESVSLSTAQTEVRFPVDLEAGQIFVASTFALSPDLDTTLTLLDADGEMLRQNDDREPGNLNSQIIIQPVRAGRFTVVVSSYSGQDIGELMLSLAIDPEADAPFDMASVERTPFDRHEGRVTSDQPIYSRTVTLEAGQTLLATADAPGEDLDPILRLEDADGHPVALNDDRGDGSLNSAIAYTAPAAGTYTLEVSGYGTSTGGFLLELSHVDASVVGTLQAVLEDPVSLSGAEQVIETADFRLYYTLEGSDATTLEFAQLTAEALQNAYTRQVTELGWAPPVRDDDNRYRAYIADARGAMGFMQPVRIVFDNPGTADVREEGASRGILVIHNDLSAGRTEAIEGLMRATVVHEFNHLVQHGYDSNEGLSWLYESTASWIEIATAGEEEDASRYAATDFASPQLCWTTATEGHDYGQWTLLESLAEHHGRDIVRRLWEQAAVHDGMDTMSMTLAEVGTTIPDALRQWRIQNFARDYDIAPRLTRAVASGGEIKRLGSWSAGPDIEELGAAYIRVRLQGAHRFVLSGGEGLELSALGVRNGQVEVIPLGRDGTFDASGYDYAALMVFNTSVPRRPGDCTGQDYAIEVSASTAAPASPAYRVDATHFAQPGA